jgi:hypothetical protein
VEELERVRWQLDRLAAARLVGWPAEALEEEYERLAREERRLMLIEKRALN